jgi:hypothetical protein
MKTNEKSVYYSCKKEELCTFVSKMDYSLGFRDIRY